MQPRKIMLLIVALVIAMATAMFAKTMLSGAGNNASTTAAVAPATEQVLVAAHDLPAGTLLKETDIKWQAWPVDAVTGAYAVKGKKDIPDYVGAIVRQGMREGEPLMSGRIVSSREQGFMAAVLKPGMRAVTVPVTPAGGVAGFVFPGDHVDVIVTHQVNRKTDPDPNGHKVSETVLTNVRVLALDQRTNDQATDPKIAQTATIEVTPKQAESLTLVTQIGTLSLALRSLTNGADEIPALNASALDPAPGVPDQRVGESSSMTWDSDISHVLEKPGNRRGSVQRVQIMRGKDTTESIFELRQ